MPMGGLTSDTRELGQVAGIAQPGYIARSLQKGLLSLLLVWRDRCEGLYSPLTPCACMRPWKCTTPVVEHSLVSKVPSTARLDSDTHLQGPMRSVQEVRAAQPTPPCTPTPGGSAQHPLLSLA